MNSGIEDSNPEVNKIICCLFNVLMYICGTSRVVETFSVALEKCQQSESKLFCFSSVTRSEYLDTSPSPSSPFFPPPCFFRHKPIVKLWSPWLRLIFSFSPSYLVFFLFLLFFFPNGLFEYTSQDILKYVIFNLIYSKNK